MDDAERFAGANPAVAIRDATPADAEAICRIYNQGIQDRVATLETEERTPEERRAWLEARDVRHPVLVVEAGGAVVGWGSLNVFNPRRAYDHVADFSLYVERSWRGRGIGGRLLAALITRARALGYHKLVLSAFPWNEAGLRVYRRAGFRTVGTYREQGLLDGRWVDTVIMEKLLDGPEGRITMPAGRTRIPSGSPWEPRVGFSRAIRVGDRVLVSGTAPIWPDGACDPDPEAQARRCLEIMVAALRQAGAGPEHVVRTRVYLTSAADAEAVGRAHGAVFGEVRPACTVVVVAGLLDPRWKVEMEAEAVLG